VQGPKGDLAQDIRPVLSPEEAQAAAVAQSEPTH